jgi:hypothetical protein
MPVTVKPQILYQASCHKVAFQVSVSRGGDMFQEELGQEIDHFIYHHIV